MKSARLEKFSLHDQNFLNNLRERFGFADKCDQAGGHFRYKRHSPSRDASTRYEQWGLAERITAGDESAEANPYSSLRWRIRSEKRSRR